jgi:hypothetical protein
MIYFQSRELSAKLGVNLAKWKRWVREFLPPDPLGGRQSGYARQFSYKSAFRVYLGGYLVAVLKFSVPEAGKILDDLEPWLKAQGFSDLNPRKSHGPISSCTDRIYIFPLDHQSFGYVIRSISGQQSLDPPENCREQFTRTLLRTPVDPLAAGSLESARVLGVSAVYTQFLRKLGL